METAEPDRLGQAERSRILLEVNNALISNLTREALFRAIAGALRRVVPFDRLAIFLHDPRRDVLRLFELESSLETPYFVVGLEMGVADSHVGMVFREQRVLLRHDLARERQYPAEERAHADGVRSYVMVPLIARGRSIGALAAASVEPGRYSAEDGAVLGEVAGQVALALSNMKAYEDLAAALEEVERLRRRLDAENAYLQEEIQGAHNFSEMVGGSPALLEVLRRVELAAPTDATVLILGETGTGKELIARALHARSARRERPLVKVNCSAISAGLVESELFGHVKGAFTGAIERRVGRFELADGGTLFLDEIGELPAEAQAKLLRVLQEQEFEPVGSSRSVRVDVRLLAATNRDLEEAVQAGRFRSDLFYRLNVVGLRVPPLRERPEDVPQLALYFLARYAKRFGKPVEAISPAAMERLVRYDWPGNVRELQNVIERAVVLAPGPVLDLDVDLGPGPGRAMSAAAGIGAAPRAAGADGAAALPTLEEMERRHIRDALERAGWLIDGPRGAARALAIHPNTLRSRMQKLGIRRPTHEMS